MLERQLLVRDLFFTGMSHKQVRFMMALLLWTGWHRSRSVVSLLRLQLLVTGTILASLIRLAVDTPGHVDFTAES